MHHPPFPAFDPPYAVGLIELAEGVRIVSNVVGVPYDKVRIGMPVRLEFRAVRRGVGAAGVPRGGGGDARMTTEAGDELPPLEIPITRTLIVAGAIASRDYQDVHHDAELAREKGSPDIFMNILTTNGLVGRYITDHFGPARRPPQGGHPARRAQLPRRHDGVDRHGRGRSTATRPTVRVVGANGIGSHVTGTVTVTVPARPGEAPA